MKHPFHKSLLLVLWLTLLGPASGYGHPDGTEDKTERNFYEFVRFDVIGKDQPLPRKTEFLYNGFPNADAALTTILGFMTAAEKQNITENEARHTYVYDDVSLRFEFTAAPPKGQPSGFASLKLKFFRRKDLKSCTVIFMEP